MIWIGLVGLLLALAILYWLLILSEGVYLGNRVVIALYDRGAFSYDRVKQVMPHYDAQHLAGPLLTGLIPSGRDGVPKSVPQPLVLDVATGTGRLPLALLRQWDFQGCVVGADLSRQMLSVARRRTAAQRQRVGLVREDALALPFSDGRFDAVTCIEALEFFPNPWSALQEMARVLRPGGRLMISNRVGVDALFFPGHAHPAATIKERLHTLGFAEVGHRRWQVHYDLIEARRSDPGRSVKQKSRAISPKE